MAKQHRVRLIQASKTYIKKDHTDSGLKNVSLDFNSGEFSAIIGKPDSGKRTLLNLIAGTDSVTEGKVIVNDINVKEMNESDRTRFRRDNIGVVFHSFPLSLELTVLENVLLPMRGNRRIPAARRKSKAIELLKFVGVADKGDLMPSELSEGERQQVAIARSMSNDPSVIIADEPTGNLDSENAERTIGLFKSLARAGKTVIMFTDETDTAEDVDRVVALLDGKVFLDERTD